MKYFIGFLILFFLSRSTFALTEQDFTRAIDNVERIYAPLARLRGATLTIYRDWPNNVENSTVYQFGKDWIVGYSGGMARRQGITFDAFQLFTCHEMGHHFGGYPFYEGQSYPIATEGQADLYAAQVCMRAIVGNDPERIKEAGLILATAFAELAQQPIPSLENHDQIEIVHTLSGHPGAQCRLDTFVSGAECEKEFPMDVIPLTEQGYFCERPKCWFRSLEGK